MILKERKTGRKANVTMKIWDRYGWSPDWSNDFFEAGSLEYDEDDETCLVDDIDYCIEQANDWRMSQGDYSDVVFEEDEEPYVFVEWL